jgi:hypothetical protein
MSSTTRHRNEQIDAGTAPFLALREEVDRRRWTHGRMKITPASSKDDAGRATSSPSQDRGGHDSIDLLFSETSRGCLGAPKNLTGPAKLASSAIVVGDKYIALSVKDGIVLK